MKTWWQSFHKIPRRKFEFSLKLFTHYFSFPCCMHTLPYFTREIFTPCHYIFWVFLHLNIKAAFSNLLKVSQCDHIFSQNSVHYHPRTETMNSVKIMICMLNFESSFTSCKIARWVTHYHMWKIAHPVKKITLCLIQNRFFHVRWNVYTWLKKMTQLAVVISASTTIFKLESFVKPKKNN